MSIELTDLQAGRIKGCVEFCKSYDRQLEIHSHAESLQLLTPKLAEPTNFGAIVKDEHGAYWQSVKDTNLIWSWWSGSVWRYWCDIKNPTPFQPGVEE